MVSGRTIRDLQLEGLGGHHHHLGNQQLISIASRSLANSLALAWPLLCNILFVVGLVRKLAFLTQPKKVQV